jgi:hypothetical protein
MYHKCKLSRKSRLFNPSLLSLDRQHLHRKINRRSKLIMWLPIKMCKSLSKSRCRMNRHHRIWRCVHHLQESKVRCIDSSERVKLIWRNLRQCSVSQRKNLFRSPDPSSVFPRIWHQLEPCTASSKILAQSWSTHRLYRLAFPWWCKYHNKCNSLSNSSHNRMSNNKPPTQKKSRTRNKFLRRSSRLSKQSDQSKIRSNPLKRRRNNWMIHPSCKFNQKSASI